MKGIIDAVFKGITIAFDSIPVLKKLKGYRTVLGFVGMGVIAVLKMNGIGNVEILTHVNTGLVAWTGLSLLAKEVE